MAGEFAFKVRIVFEDWEDFCPVIRAAGIPGGSATEMAAGFDRLDDAGNRRMRGRPRRFVQSGGLAERQYQRSRQADRSTFRGAVNGACWVPAA